MENAPGDQVRIARVFDLVNPETGACFAPDHLLIDDAAERAAIVDYLNAGAPLMLTERLLGDVVEPARGDVVPVNFRTDGTFIWVDAVAYYLDQHRLAPDAELLAHVRRSGPLPPELDTEALYRASAALSRPPASAPVWGPS